MTAPDRQIVAAAAQAIHRLTCAADQMPAHCDGPTTRDFDLARSSVNAAAAAIRAAERARILSGARALAFTLWRPGYGSGEAHASALEVVPLEELLKMIGGKGP